MKVKTTLAKGKHRAADEQYTCYNNFNESAVDFMIKSDAKQSNRNFAKSKNFPAFVA